LLPKSRQASGLTAGWVPFAEVWILLVLTIQMIIVYINNQWLCCFVYKAFKETNMLKEVLAHVRQYPGITLESLMDLHAADAEYMSALLAKLTKNGQLLAMETGCAESGRCREGGNKPSRICFFCSAEDKASLEYSQSVMLHS
jgi:hypothetical protein